MCADVFFRLLFLNKIKCSVGGDYVKLYIKLLIVKPVLTPLDIRRSILVTTQGQWVFYRCNLTDCHDVQTRNGACFLWQAKNDPASQAKKADPSKKAEVKPTTPAAKKPVEKKEGQCCTLRCLIQTFT